MYADDVAAAIAQILRQSQKPYPVYELAGPRVYSYEELLRTIARVAGLRPVLMRTPFALWDALAGLAEMLPQPPLTRNQVELMQIDTTASKTCRGFAHSEFRRDRSKTNSKRCSSRATRKLNYQTAEEVCRRLGRFRYRDHPIVLPWPLQRSLEAATRALFESGRPSFR